MSSIQAKYYAAKFLSKQDLNLTEEITQSVLMANIVINPHQVGAAKFALESPFSKGVILADEVGLGKTIEAGLVICQLWAENKRKILIICPASLRKQWSLELSEKFNLPSLLIDSKTYTAQQKKGNVKFANKEIIIMSYHYASNIHEIIAQSDWDLVVCDEAHKLSNSFRETNIQASRIKAAIMMRRKLFLTATPMQNNLMELYGLISCIDPRIFGSANNFRYKYINNNNDHILKEKIASICYRTLRKDVTSYINYTNRSVILQQYALSPAEQNFYKQLLAFLQEENCYAVTHSKTLIMIGLFKVLASSTYAVAHSLENIFEGLKRKKAGVLYVQKNFTDMLEQEILEFQEKNFEGEDFADAIFTDILTEYSDNHLNNDVDEKSAIPNESKYMNIPINPMLVFDEDLLDGFNNFYNEGNTDGFDFFYKELEETPEDSIDMDALDAEIVAVAELLQMIKEIDSDSKATALLKALQKGFEELEKNKANKKILIFTESRRTQEYLFNFLTKNGYEAKLATFNGSNTEKKSDEIYKNWDLKYKNTAQISGVLQADKRNAIIEYFQEEAEILIATEAAAEGLNLQFCSLIINYDLPWNPQRIEQRIGRCHRYGQKSDVIIINFLNVHNYVEEKMYNFLTEKLNLFDGVFGVSNEVLGSLSSGVDLEKTVFEIYKNCRTREQIESEFDELQRKIGKQINEDRQNAKIELFETVTPSALKKINIDTGVSMHSHLELFWEMTRIVLKDNAHFNNEDKTFYLKKDIDKTPKGDYFLKSSDNLTENQDVYSPNSDLGKYVLREATNPKAIHRKVIFTAKQNDQKTLDMLKSLEGCSGYLSLRKVSINIFPKEEFLLFLGMQDNRRKLSSTLCELLFDCDMAEEDIIIPQETSWVLWNLNKNVIFEKLRYARIEVERRFSKERDKARKWTEESRDILKTQLDVVKSQMIETEERLIANYRDQLWHKKTFSSKVCYSLDLDINSTADTRALKKKINTLNKTKIALLKEIELHETSVVNEQQRFYRDLSNGVYTPTCTNEEIFTVRWEYI